MTRKSDMEGSAEPTRAPVERSPQNLPSEQSGGESSASNGNNSSPLVARLRNLLFRRMLIGVSDGRFFLGVFHCIDRQGNIILQDAVEYRSTRRSSPSPMDQRCLGLILIPAACRSSCHVDCSIDEQLSLLSLKWKTRWFFYINLHSVTETVWSYVIFCDVELGLLSAITPSRSNVHECMFCILSDNIWVFLWYYFLWLCPFLWLQKCHVMLARVHVLDSSKERSAYDIDLGGSFLLLLLCEKLKPKPWMPLTSVDMREE